LISQYARPGGTGFEICCGRSADLNKYFHVGVKYLLGVDIADQSIVVATSRYNGKDGKYIRENMQAEFKCYDCHQSKLTAYLKSNDIWFDIVSCQFAIHYAFETEERLDGFFTNVTCKMAKGSYFIATFMRKDYILKQIKLKQTPIIKGNLYSITMNLIDYYDYLQEENSNSVETDDRQSLTATASTAVSCINNSSSTDSVSDNVNKKSTFGQKYTFFLKDSIYNLPEYLVDVETLNKYANKYKLTQIYTGTFNELHASAQTEIKYQTLYNKMQCTTLSDDEQEVVDLYRCVVYEYV
jgi:mRNA (guanine-N7-)-methyltransferase